MSPALHRALERETALRARERIVSKLLGLLELVALDILRLLPYWHPYRRLVESSIHRYRQVRQSALD
jgi:hypothetical protein